MGEILVGERAQSSVLGVVLVLAIVIAGSTLTVALGAEAFSSTTDRLQGDRAEQSMTQLDSQIAMVGLGSSDRQQVQLAGSGTDYVVHDDVGTMEVSYTNLSSGSTTTIFREEMGAVVYEKAGTTIAYQGGGVWRLSEEGGAAMISPPEFHYRDATLTLPLVTVSGDGSLGGNGATVVDNGSKRYFPNRSVNSDFLNPLEGSRVQVTVESEYYEAWGQYFEQRTDGTVTYDHPNERVTIELVSPIDRPTISSASSSLAASGTFSINGAAKSSCGAVSKTYTDSYNSSGTTDDYCTQANNGATGNDGDIVYGSNIDISNGAGNSDIYGDIVSGKSVDADSSGGGAPDVYGNINYTDSCTDCAGAVQGSGTVNQIDGTDSTPNINPVVRARVNNLRSDNDNGDPGVPISGNTLDYTSDEATLEAGQYYLKEITPADEDKTVRLDTTSGDITIAVRENIALPGSGSGGADIKVVGDGTVKIYVAGAGSHTWDLQMGKNAQIHNDGDDAPQLRVLGMDNFTAQIGTSSGNLARFVGAIYAPPGSSGTGEVEINGGEIYGGVVTGTTEITSKKGSLHYDEALEREAMVSQTQNSVRVTYLHVSTNDVNVTSG